MHMDHTVSPNQLDIELAEPHRLFVEHVWKRFRDNGRWPQAAMIENALRRKLDPKTNTYDVFRTLPSVIGWAQIGADLEARLTPIALAVVVPDDARQAIDDFFRAFQLCRRRYLDAGEDESARLCSGDLGELGYDELRIRRTVVLLRDRRLLQFFTGGMDVDNGVQYGWELDIYVPVINRYRDVESLDEYFAELREELTSLATSPGFVPEGLPIEPIQVVRFQPTPIQSVVDALPRGDIHIHIEGSTVGNVVVGTVANIQSNINISRGISGEDLAVALRAVTEACLADQDFTDDQRQEALEAIEYLSEAATKPPEQRRIRNIRTIAAGLAAVMATAAQAGQIWQEWGPVITQAFHVSGH